MTSDNAQAARRAAFAITTLAISAATPIPGRVWPSVKAMWSFLPLRRSIYGIRALARTLITRTKTSTICVPSGRSSVAGHLLSKTIRTLMCVPWLRIRDWMPINRSILHRFDHLLPLTKAIIHHENGQQPYTDAQITKALVLAGVEPEATSLQKTRTVKGGQAATAATAGLGVVEAVQQTLDPARDALIGIAPYLETAKWLLLAVTLIGIGVMLWARIDDHRKGLR
jgi:hypothetical protein